MWFVDGDGDGVAEVVAEFGEGFGRDVEDDVAEGAVEAEDFAVEAGGVEGGVVDVRGGRAWRRRGRGRPGSSRRRGPGGLRRGEDVAAVEGGGEFGADHPGGVGDLAGFEDLVFAGGGEEGEEAVVGEDEVLAAAGVGDDGFAGAADGGVDDDDEDGVGGEVGRGAGEEAGAFGDVVGRDLVGDVDDADGGVDADHDGFADADGVVFDVEVGHEADDVLGLLGVKSGR